jgi:hypothetical protein
VVGALRGVSWDTSLRWPSTQRPVYRFGHALPLIVRGEAGDAWSLVQDVEVCEGCRRVWYALPFASSRDLTCRAGSRLVPATPGRQLRRSNDRRADAAKVRLAVSRAAASGPVEEAVARAVSPVPRCMARVEAGAVRRHGTRALLICQTHAHAGCAEDEESGIPLLPMPCIAARAWHPSAGACNGNEYANRALERLVSCSDRTSSFTRAPYSCPGQLGGLGLALSIHP